MQALVMQARRTTGIGLALVAACVIGCSDSAPSTPAAGPATTAQSPSARPSDPIAATAYEFLDAVFAGDTDRADRQLTPAAAEQLARSGQRFAPPGSGPTGFTIGEVRVLGEGRAAVECFVRGELDGQQAEESLGCLLRKSGGRWGVSGIAYEVSPGNPPTIFDFERSTEPLGPDFVEKSPSGGSPTARVATDPASNQTR